MSAAQYDIYMEARINAKDLPSYRLAQETSKIMMTTWGGLGDQVCAEPALRYAFKLFPNHEISLLTSFPELFSHLPFHKVYTKDQTSELNEADYIVIHTNHHGGIGSEFLHHHFTQPVDFSTLCAFQRQIPIKERIIRTPFPTVREFDVLLHPGRHWPSKTFPREWWEAIALELSGRRINVAIVGKDISSELGTVEMDVPIGAVDLRNKLTLPEFVSQLLGTKVLITGDSAPLHLASSGTAHIGFVTTSKHPDHLLHYRARGFGWRMQNLGKGGYWEHDPGYPIRSDQYRIDLLPEGMLESVLPSPQEVVEYVLTCLNQGV